MAEQAVEGVPDVIIDDGAAFTFAIGNVSFGFMHRPSDTVKLVGGTVTPPVTWTVYHNLESWVETIKYALRNNTKITVIYDDAIYINYRSWSYTYPSGGGGGGSDFQQVYSIAIIG